jgi:[acyl-carrier-protein] S-malonyltransferase
MKLAAELGAKRVVRLSVSGAFHSTLMEPAAAEFEPWLEQQSFHDPGFPIIANVTAEPVSTGDAARALLVRQLTSPVQWAASVLHMAESGVDRFLEIGPGSVLRGLNRRIIKTIPCSSLGEPDDLEVWEP